MSAAEWERVYREAPPELQAMLDRDPFLMCDDPGDPDFDGPAYDAALDHARLTGQIMRVFDCMSDGRWRTLVEIEGITGDPHASISAQLRHLRKPKFGGHTVDKRRRTAASGLWEYRVLTRT